MPYYFDLPSYDRLNPRQRVAVVEEGAVALSGGPGTGKSVVSVWRHITNYSSDIRASVLLTYTKSLKYYLAESVKSRARAEQDNVKKSKIESAGRHVGLANSWKGRKYDELIIDEAQDLPENQIDEDWDRGFLRYIMKYSDLISYGADDKQIIYPKKATNQQRLGELFPNATAHTLFTNYRNTYHILNFARHLLDFDISSSILERLKAENEGSKPILKLLDDYDEENAAILDIIGDFNDGATNIAILVPFVKQVNDLCEFFEETGYKLNGGDSESYSNYHNERQGISNIENVHITTFKSSKGLEFDVVIIPEFGSYKKFMRNYRVVEDKDYYVAITRARRNLFLLSNRNLDINSSIYNIEEFSPEENNIEVDTPDDLPF